MGSGLKTVLIVDGGGRGAALVDKYAESKHVGKILVVPGNDLMQINTAKSVITYPNLKTTSIREILDLCKSEQIDLVDVAQDNAVEAGLVNELEKMGIMSVGPTREAGRLEWDKAWAREFMDKNDIPSPRFFIFKSQLDAIDFVKKNPKKRWFVKASGLAEGKGAIPASNLAEAVAAIKQMSDFGVSGEIFVLEEWLSGEEFSAFALCDGENLEIVGYAQDHKRVNDGDTGPNTGGMGCVSNPLVVDTRIKNQVSSIMKKVVKRMKHEGRPYKGVLYLGGMVVGGKVYVIEFNARWGDPEAEVIVPSIINDFWEVGMAIVNKKLNELKLSSDNLTRVAVALSAKGYPVNYKQVLGKKITGLEKIQNMGVKVYGAGVRKLGNDYVVNGGRVLFVVAEGQGVEEVLRLVYSAVSKVNIEGNNLHFRHDIGWRDIERLNKND